ncbi:MAG: signal peptidase I [Planctomycetes bacterium]|nr:signal peptidase I [Planctomycetota bacterium]
MMPDERSNDFFGHLDQPAPPTPRRLRRPDEADFSSVPDPFGDGPPSPPPATPPGGTARPAPRPPSGQVKGPGLSPGIPKINQTPSREVPRSGVVLTPGGIKRVDDAPKSAARAKPQPQPVAPPEPESGIIDAADADEPAEFHEQSRQQNDQDDVSWEEYAASGFPAMAAEEFGVKTKTTDSGRIVPVAVRNDLTEDALKGKSIKDKGRTRRPTAKVKGGAAPAAPRSFMQRIGDSLRLTRPNFDESEETEAGTSTEESSGGKGFAKSGSQQGKGGARRKKSPLRMAWGVVVEAGKIFMLVLLLRAYVVQVSQVQGPSMEPTLQGGDTSKGETADRLVVERITPLFASQKPGGWVRYIPDFLRPELKHGDIIVVRSPEDPGAELVKRLIGLPGDTLKFEEGRLWRKPAGGADFAAVEESYLGAEELRNEDGSFRSYGLTGDLGSFVREGVEIVVPPDRLFLMGDNRTRSNDSRRWLQIDVNVSDPPGVDRLWVHLSSVEGVVVFRIFPFDRIWPPVK